MKFMEISNGLSIYEHYKLDAEEENTPQKYFFIFNEKDLLLIDNEVPLLNSLIDIGIEEEDIKNNIFMGQFHDKDTYVIGLDLDEESKMKFIESHEGFEFVFLAKVFDQLLFHGSHIRLALKSMKMSSNISYFQGSSLHVHHKNELFFKIDKKIELISKIKK